LWLETSLEESLTSSQRVDGANIYEWKSLTKRSTTYYALKTPSSAVTFEEKSPISSLPSINFNGSTGSNSYLTISSTQSTSNYTFIPSPSCTTTWFVVMKPRNTISNTDPRYLIHNGSIGNYSGYGYYIANSARYLVYITLGALNSSTNLSLNPEITSYVFDGGYSLYSNGANIATSSSRNCKQPFYTSPSVYARFYIGYGRNATKAWDGYISEIIFYDRALKNSERHAVEKYLGQKYGIKVSSQS
jgi:hypothetical protein